MLPPGLAGEALLLIRPRRAIAVAAWLPYVALVVALILALLPFLLCRERYH